MDGRIGWVAMLVAIVLLAACGRRRDDHHTTTRAAPRPARDASAARDAGPRDAGVDSGVDAGTVGVVRALQLAAFAREDWDAVCTALEFQQFDRTTCDWIARKASNGDAGAPNPRTLEAFFRRHRVARTSGSIVALLDEGSAGDTYEARIRGRVSYLETIDTRFSTTGAFSMWAQRNEDEEAEMASGAIRLVGSYSEWPLADMILNLGRARGDDAKASARRLLEYVIDEWVLDASEAVTIPRDDEWPAFAAARTDAGMAATSSPSSR